MLFKGRTNMVDEGSWMVDGEYCTKPCRPPPPPKAAAVPGGSPEGTPGDKFMGCTLCAVVGGVMVWKEAEEG